MIRAAVVFIVNCFLASVLLVGAAHSALISPSALADIEREQAARLKQLQESQKQIEDITQPSLLPETTPADDLQCFTIHTIHFSGNSILSDDELNTIIDFPKEKCIGLNGINEVLKKITNVYIAKGYVTSRAFLTPQDLSSGTLEIVIIEGKLEKLLFNNQSESSLNMAFPGLVDKVLNLRDIEQGLDQINRLSRYNAKIKLLPGSKPGYSIVNIETQIGAFGSASLGFNNGGQKSTGETQLSASVSAYNILGLLDSLSLSGSKSSEFSTYFNAENISAAIAIPYGYWDVSYRYSYSTYLTTITNKSLNFDSSGNTNNHDLTTKWLFYRDEISKSSLQMGLNYREDKNYILGSLLTGSSRNLSSLSIGIDHSTRLGRGFFTVSPQYYRGIKLFNSESDANKAKGLPSAEFNKGTLTVRYSQPLTSWVSLSSTVFGQWSNDTLYGSQRMSVGGEYSVRGFKEQSISGDQGYYWRNDLNFALGQYPILGRVSSQLAVDTGAIHPDKYDRFERGHLTGAGLSVSSQANHYTSSITLGVPLETPEWLDADDYSLYYRINVSI